MIPASPPISSHPGKKVTPTTPPRRWALIVLLAIVVLLGGGGASGEEYQNAKPSKCVRITIPMCSDIQYNMTIYPNLLKHTKQEEAENDIVQYEMLVKVSCSPDFKFFLCTLFTPVCTVLEEPIPPCRHLCLSAKNGCESLMRKFGYVWPAILECDKFPDEGVCVGENRTKSTPPPQSPSSSTSHNNPLPNLPAFDLECPHTMKVLSRARHSLPIANTSIEQCSLPCQGDGVVPTLLSTPVRQYLRLWTGAWAVLCFVCTLFTVTTFLIDLQRFEFPERAILHMSLCYLAVSATYMVGLVAEDGLSCSAVSATKAPLVSQGIDSFACTATAVAHYFFSTAGLLWWLILCFSWFLVTTLKWGEAPVGLVFSNYFNVLAWFLPAVMVIAILVTSSIDGDLYSGICSVGNLQPAALMNFVVIPQAIIIALGLALFGCGFISIMRIRSYIKGQRFTTTFEKMEASEKVGKLMLRISTFSLLYIAPIIVGELATYYQAANLEDWLTSWYSTRCLHARRNTFGFTQPRESCHISERAALGHRAPEPALFFIRYMSYFTMGIACTLWSVNGKTFSSYSDFYSRLFRRGASRRVPTNER